MPALLGLVNKITVKKEVQARILAKIKAIKRTRLLSFNIQELYQNFKINAKFDFWANTGII